jgi:hypothetical protein
MQGIKEYQEKFFVSFRLSERIPDDNFYRQLKDKLDLSYLRQLTQKYYGREGQKSIDTEVFFKLMLIGYLENIPSDRKIIETAGMRMDKAYKLINTQQGKRMMRLRAATVESVWGTLLHFRRLKKVYTKGNDLANKQVLMAAAAYNLKKLIHFKTIKHTTNAIKNIAMDIKLEIMNVRLTIYDFFCWLLQNKTLKIQSLTVTYGLENCSNPTSTTNLRLLKT